MSFAEEGYPREVYVVDFHQRKDGPTGYASSRESRAIVFSDRDLRKRTFIAGDRFLGVYFVSDVRRATANNGVNMAITTEQFNSYDTHTGNFLC